MSDMFNIKKVIIKVNADDVFEYGKNEKIKFRTDLTKKDIDYIGIEGDKIDLKDLDAKQLTEKISNVQPLHIRPYGKSVITDYDNDNYKNKITTVEKYVKSMKDLKQADKQLIDLFFKKYVAKYNAGVKKQQTEIKKQPLTYDAIITEQKIQYAQDSTTQYNVFFDNKGAEKNADDLLNFLKAVVDSRTKFNTVLVSLKDKKTVNSKMFNKIMNSVFRKTKAGLDRYNYYAAADGEDISKLNLTNIGTVEYIGINPKNNDLIQADSTDPTKFTEIVKTFTNNFEGNIKQILLTEKTKNGGKKSRKLSKGGRRRKTRSNKFA